MAKLKINRAALVYQAGIANVFQLNGDCSALDGSRSVRRLLQSDFRSCENFARGLKAAGVDVRTFACNRAGDIAAQDWSDNLDEQPFSDKFQAI